MTSELHDLYQEAILEHSRRPRNVRTIDGARRGDAYNRVCGDRVTVYVLVEDDAVADVSFQASGCTILTASASLMTESVKGQGVSAIGALFNRLQQMLSMPPDARVDDLGSLTPLAGVRWFPVRVRCAVLPWQALQTALDQRDSPLASR